MSDMSPGERAVLRFRWFVYDAGARPVVVVAVLAAMGALAAMASSVVGASASQVGGFRPWIFFAVDGFKTDVQLALVAAVVLLVVDAVTGEAFRGQRTIFGGLVIVAAVGVIANLTATVAWVTEVGIPLKVGVGTTAEAWTAIIASYLAPTVLACASAWVALRCARSFGLARRDRI